MTLYQSARISLAGVEGTTERAPEDEGRPHEPERIVGLPLGPGKVEVGGRIPRVRQSNLPWRCPPGFVNRLAEPILETLAEITMGVRSTQA